MAQDESGILERGDIFFLYRPKVEEDSPEGLEDVQRFHVVLRPEGQRRERLLVIGRKRLPDAGRREREWGFVERVSTPRQVDEELAPETYQTKTRGERHLPGARPAGEGRYAIVRHEDHTHLAYRLELPREPGDVQHELNIEPEGSYVISIKNPQKGAPRGAGLPRGQKAALPERLQARFRDRRFADADPPAFLDHEGTEFLLVGAAEDVEEDLGIRLDAQRESEHSADLLRQHDLDPQAHPREPLMEGDWR